LSAKPPETLILQFGPMFSNECKIENNFIAHKKQITYEQAALERFQLLLEKSKKVKNKRNYFDKSFSRHMKANVIAPAIAYDAFEYEVFGPDRSDEFKSLFLSLYQGNQIKTSRMPAIAISNSYAVKRHSDEKIKITKEIILNVGLDIADDFGFDLVNCENFHLLPSEKNTKGS
jgi:hypothetical protein